MLFLLHASVAWALESPVTMLVCREGDGCEDERAWLAARQPGLILVVDAHSSRDAFVVEDGGRTFATEVEAADYAVQDGKWKTALTHLDAAEAALAKWPGTVENHLLVRMYVLRGVALRHRATGGFEVAMRSGAAAAWSGEPDLRGLQPEDQFALDTERRKLITSGTGTLAVAGTASWWLDGVPVERSEIDVLPGAHRLTAVQAGKLRTFSAVVPVLPDRTVTVNPNWGPADDTEWLLTEFSVGIATLSAAPEALSLLSDWCARNEVSLLELVEVDGARVSATPAAVAQSAAPDRPAALAGEVLSGEDAIPATFEGAVVAKAEAGAEVAPPHTEWRLHAAFFEPTTRRLSSEPSAIHIVKTDDTRRFSIGVRGGWLHLGEHEHGTVDLAANWRLASGFGVRGEAGLAVADMDYRFYDDWQDNKLLHGAVALTWGNVGKVSPLASAGVEVEAPLWAGAYGEVGVRAVFDEVWVAEGLARFGIGSSAGEPMGAYGIGAGLSRRW